MIKNIVAAAALVAASSGAIAADAPAFYVGADVSSTKIDGFERDGGFGAFIGYQFNENIAIEAGYHRLGEVEFARGVDLTFDQLDVSVLGTVPLSDGFSVFGRLGYNRLEGDASGISYNWSDTGLVYGAGLAYSFTPVISGRVEVQKPASDATKIAVGLSYKF